MIDDLEVRLATQTSDKEQVTKSKRAIDIEAGIAEPASHRSRYTRFSPGGVAPSPVRNLSA